APPDALDEEGELMRQELAERLREYARVKALGTWLGEREAEQALLYGRTVAELPPPEDVPLEDLSVHLLQRAMTRLIEEQKRQTPREVEPNPLSVLERMGEIIELLRHTWSLLFTSVAGAERLRTEWVVTLLALLELVRLGQARVHQAELFGDIVIESGPHNEPAPEFSLGAAPEDAESTAGDRPLPWPHRRPRTPPLRLGDAGGGRPHPGSAGAGIGGGSARARARARGPPRRARQRAPGHRGGRRLSSRHAAGGGA